MSRESPARVRANVSKDRPRRQPPHEGAGGDLSQNGYGGANAKEFALRDHLVPSVRY